MADLPFSGLPLDPSINAAPLQSLYAPTPQIPTEIASRGGMFGGNAQMALMAAISGLMARRHPQVSQMMQNMLLLKQKQALAQQQRQQGIADDFTKFKQQYDYELKNPKQTEPHYFQDNSGNEWAVGADGKPVQVYNDPLHVKFIPNGMGGVVPVDVTKYMGGAQQPPSTPLTDDDIVRMSGGPTPSASGGFSGY
jgi:hypothetical protein